MFVTVFVVFFLYSLQFVGPAILSDEVGYLTKAAALSGNITDSSSSYYAGYSLILVPLFFLFENPFYIWRAVMAVNAMLFAGSFVVLYFLLKSLFPKRTFLQIIAVVAVSAAYPSWIIMSGYAFATPIFVFVFVLTTYLLSVIENKKLPFYLLLALLLGYMYWIHPMGGVVAVVGLVMLALKLVYEGKYLYLACLAGISIALILAYSFIVSPWFLEVMTPEGFVSNDHYKNLGFSLSQVFNFKFITGLVLTILGHASYLVIATFGVILSSVPKKFNSNWRDYSPKQLIAGSVFTKLFMITSLLSVIVAGAALFSINQLNGVFRFDHWIYGRYSDMVLLPVLALGIISSQNKRRHILGAIFIVVSGLLLQLSVSTFGVTDVNNIVASPAFWPQAIFRDNNYFVWFLLGAIGIMAVTIFRTKALIVLVFPLILITVHYQTYWHKNLLNGYSQPTGLSTHIRSLDNVNCIGTDSSKLTGDQSERIRINGFYLYDYELQRMQIDNWIDSECNVYLTYDSDAFSGRDNVIAISREYVSGLYAFAKVVDVSGVNSQEVLKGIYINSAYPFDQSCILNGCFSMDESEVQKFQSDKVLKSNRPPTSNVDYEYLFWGPYYPLEQGSYKLVLSGKLEDVDGAVVEVISNIPEKIIKTKTLEIGPGTEQAEVQFDLAQDSEQLEVRLLVKSGSKTPKIEYKIEAR
jgi:hypothetical protein